jgi:hypothetical protein
MRGKPDYNREEFDAVETALRVMLGQNLNDGEILFADSVINPRNSFDGDVSRPPSEYMAADLRYVLDADVIVLLPDWQKSQGANREAQLGVWAGKRFMKAELVTGNGHSAWSILPIDAPEFSESVRASVLDEAKQLITGDRNNAYGPPWQDFARTAGALAAMGYAGPNGRPIEAHDIAIFVMMVKLSRLMWTPTKRDSWVDIAGYAGCGYECALADEEMRRAA